MLHYYLALLGIDDEQMGWQFEKEALRIEKLLVLKQKIYHCHACWPHRWVNFILKNPKNQ